jgi:hypothetical protein
MTMIAAILIASAAVYSWKFFGYLVPESFLEKPAVSRIAGLLTVALLSALMATQALTKGAEIVLDARIVSMLVSAVLLRFKAPFLVVVAAAAATAALLRLLGF